MEWIILLMIICIILVMIIIYFDQRKYCRDCHKFVKLSTLIIEQDDKSILYKVEAICPKCSKVLYSGYYRYYLDYEL